MMMACHGMVRTYCSYRGSASPCPELSRYQGKGHPCARRHQGGEFLGAGKRRVEGMEGKGEPSTGRRIRKADAHAHSPVRKNGAGSMCAEARMQKLFHMRSRATGLFLPSRELRAYV